MLLSAALLLLAPSVWAGMYGKPVINLDAKTFKQAMSVEHASMVAFVAPWCGHCKALAPEYTSAASSLSPLIPFYAVDCDVSANKPLCAQYDIKGFPTIKAFPRALKGAVKDYGGGRKAGELVEYAKTLVPDRVKKLRVSADAVDAMAKDGVQGAVDAWLRDKRDMPHVLLIHPTQPSIPFLWKVLSHRMSSRASMGYVRDTPDHGIITSLGVYNTSDPARDPVRAVYWPKGAKRGQLVEYEGAFKFNALLDWILNQLESDTPPPERDLPTASAGTGGHHAKPSPPSGDDTDPKARKAAADRAAEAERKAKLKARMEEAERRDQARRDKLARAKAAAAESAESDEQGAAEDGTPVEPKDAGEQVDAAAKEPATPVDAPLPQAEESVEEQMLEGQSPPIGLEQDARDPEPEGAAEGAQGPRQGQEAQETRVHEEL